MRLNIAKVKQITGSKLEFNMEESVKDLESKQDDVHFLSPLRMSGQVENPGGRVFDIHGKFSAVIESFCYRCLEKAKVDINMEFFWKFTDVTQEQDEELYHFTGDEIDLWPSIYDELILKWPSQVLCKPDCKGLCPKCGANLNETTCTCEKTNIDPRLAVLEQLLNSE